MLCVRVFIHIQTQIFLMRKSVSNNQIYPISNPNVFFYEKKLPWDKMDDKEYVRWESFGSRWSCHTLSQVIGLFSPLLSVFIGRSSAFKIQTLLLIYEYVSKCREYNIKAFDYLAQGYLLELAMAYSDLCHDNLLNMLVWITVFDLTIMQQLEENGGEKYKVSIIVG